MRQVNYFQRGGRREPLALGGRSDMGAADARKGGGGRPSAPPESLRERGISGGRQ